MPKVCNEGIVVYLEALLMYVTPKIPYVFEEVNVGSWSYLIEHQPPKIRTPHSMKSMRL